MSNIFRSVNKLVIFDVCNTLVDANSTYDYIRFLINHGIKKHYRIFFIKRYIWLFYAILNKIFQKDTQREITLRFMKGLKKKDLEEINRKFFQRYDSKIRKDTFDRLILDNRKYDTILLSASINPPIDYLKEKYHLKWFSSQLEEQNWIYTGKLLRSLRGEKEKIFQEGLFTLESYKEVDFYTDNQDDTPLINYLNKLGKDLKVYIIPYNNKWYRKDYFNLTKIAYEFIS